MKRRGLINWKEKLSAAPPAQQTISQLLPSIDMPAGQPSHSPTRATSRLGRQQTSTTSPGFSKAPIEFKASLSIHVQETNVLTAGLSGSDSQEIFLGDNEHFQEGDFVEVTPIGSEETSNRTTSARSAIEKATQAALNKQNSQQQDRDDGQQQSLDTPRLSLVVTLKNFYRTDKTQKKMLVSIEQTLAELHGLRKDMQVKVRKISKAELRDFTKAAKAGSQKKRGHSNSRVSRQNSWRKNQQLQGLVADRLEVTVRDQLVSRRDMWQLVQMLNERTVFKGTAIDLQSIRFKIRSIYTSHSGEEKKNAFQGNFSSPNGKAFNFNVNSSTATPNNSTEVSYVEQNSAIVSTSYTRVTFYSKSCQVYVLIEISKEMYSFDSEGFLQKEKCMHFVRSYLERCKADYSTHEIVFILYARVYYPQVKGPEELLDEVEKYTGRKDLTLEDLLYKDGAYQFSGSRIFQDIYLKAGVVNLSLENTKADYDKFLVQLRSYLQKFPQLVNWQINCPINVRKDEWTNLAADQKDCLNLPCELGDSERTNILEVINLALFNLNNEEIDQNLRTTGTQMLILTAGQATYRVNPAIISPTKSRLLLGGVQVQMISLAREPPYKTPLLIKCCEYSNPFEKSSPGMHPSPSRSNLLKQSLVDASSLNNEHQENKQSKDTNFFQLEWMKVFFLPHIKLLDSHIQIQQRKASALLSLSKTPLLAPQFSQFQQARLLAEVFGGLTKRDERLFEPHSMFRTSTLKLNSFQKKKGDSFSKSLKAVESLRDFKSETQNKPKKPKYWRMDPDMYKLRKPQNGNDRFLLDGDNIIESIQKLKEKMELEDDRSSITLQESSCTFAGNNSDVDESYLERSADEVTFLDKSTKGMASYLSPKHKQQQSSVAVNVTTQQPQVLSPNRRNLRSRQTLRTKMLMHDAKIRGEPVPVQHTFDSPITSLASSPMKYNIHSALHPNSPESQRVRFGMTVVVGDQSPTLSENENIFSGLVNESETRFFLNSILSPPLQEDQAKFEKAQTNAMTCPIRQTMQPSGTQVAQSQAIEQSDLKKFRVASPPASSRFIDNNKNMMAISTTAVRKFNHLHPVQQSIVVAQNQQQSKLQDREDPTHLRSYARRWGHAIGVCQFSIFKKSANLAQTAYSLSYDQMQEQGGFDKRLNAYDLAITQNHFEPLCKLMDNFWKQLSDVALMPLTTAYYSNDPEKSPQYIHDHNFESDRRRDYAEENLCLRLTQNFQFFNERGCCDVQVTEGSTSQFEYFMAFRDIFSHCFVRNNDFKSNIWFKYSVEKDSHLQTVAQFNYLLFNHHTRRFQAKTSQENRLFDIKKLKNLDQCQNDIKEAQQNCVKLPQLGFVIFYDRQVAQKLREAEYADQIGGKAPQQTALQEDEEELREFTKLRKGLVEILLSNSKSHGRTTLLQQVRTHKSSQAVRQYPLVTELVRDHPQSSIFYNKQKKKFTSSTISNSAKKPQIMALNSPADDETTSLDANGQPRNRTNQTTPTKMNKELINNDIPNTIIEIAESPESSFSIGQSDTLNMTQAIGSFNIHSSLSPHMQSQYPFSTMMQSQHTHQQVTSSRERRISSDTMLTTQRHVIRLNSSPTTATSNYVFEHDNHYTTGSCFRIKFEWILAKGPELQERVIKRLTRKVSEISNGKFKILPLSEIMHSMQLNPFELETSLRKDCPQRIRDEFVRQNNETKKQIEANRKSVLPNDDFEINFLEDDEVNNQGATMWRDYSQAQNPTVIVQKTFIEMHEKLFQTCFPRLLVSQCGYVYDRKIKGKEETCVAETNTYCYYLERECGLSSVKYNPYSNEVAYLENDIINNVHGDYQASIKAKDKVESTIIALDILLELIVSDCYEKSQHQ